MSSPRYFGVLRDCHTYAHKFILYGIDINLLFCSSFFSAANAKIAVKLCFTIFPSGLHLTGNHLFHCVVSSLIEHCSHLHAPSLPSLGIAPWTGTAHILVLQLGLQRFLLCSLESLDPWCGVTFSVETARSLFPSLLFYSVLQSIIVLGEIILTILIIDPLLLESIQA